MGQGTKHLIALSFLMVCRVYCVEFNRKSTGVTFQPYVLNTTANLYTIYTIEDVKAMLKVVSSRFSRIATFGYSNTAYYQENVTYYNTYSEVYTAEAAALLNREAILTNNTPYFSVFIGIWLYTDPDRMNTEIKLAFESARKSNLIHPGTSLGLILRTDNIADNLTIANLAILEAQKIKAEANFLNLKIGIRIGCDGYKTILNTPENKRDLLSDARISLLHQFDFIICIRYATDYYPLEITKTIYLVTKDLLQIRNYMQSINPNVEFMVESRLTSPFTTETYYQYFLHFWTMMDQWGTKNNISIWMQEAFDNPWKHKLYGTIYSQAGWWKYKNGLPLTDVHSYEEKVAKLLTNATSQITTTEKLHSEQQTSSAVTRMYTSTSYNVQLDITTKPQIISNDNGSNVWVYIGGILGPTIAMIALAMMVIQWIRTNNIRRFILTSEEIKAFMYGPSSKKATDGNNGNIEMHALSKPYDKSIEIPKNRFQINWSSILGAGEFGMVYKANILAFDDKNVDQVALKMSKDSCPKTAVMSILSEIKIMLYLGQHENLVSIKGAYTAEIAKGVVYVATEICELGSLKDFLRRMPKIDKTEERYELKPQSSTQSISHVEVTEMVKWSFEIACGMEYLAEKNVIHADLAARNVLLTADKTAKITDFGLSRRLYEYTNYVKKQQEPLPWRWMAIEALKKLEFSTQSDVWSYGVTLWEIFSMGDVPYPGLSWTLEFVDNLETGLRMKCPRLASPEIYVLMSSCWEQEPQNRPTFTQLKQSLARMNEFNRKGSNGEKN